MADSPERLPRYRAGEFPDSCRVVCPVCEIALQPGVLYSATEVRRACSPECAQDARQLRQDQPHAISGADVEKSHADAATGRYSAERVHVLERVAEGARLPHRLVLDAALAALDEMEARR